MKLIGIKETCLYIRDLDAARKFYHEVLGLPVISFLEGKHIFFRAGRSVLLCFNPADSITKESPPPHHAEGKIHFAFEVSRDNYERTRAELEEKGVRITDTVKWESGTESFYFEDPAGNVLEVVPDRGIWD